MHHCSCRETSVCSENKKKFLRAYLHIKKLQLAICIGEHNAMGAWGEHEHQMCNRQSIFFVDVAAMYSFHLLLLFDLSFEWFSNPSYGQATRHKMRAIRLPRVAWLRAEISAVMNLFATINCEFIRKLISAFTRNDIVSNTSSLRTEKCILLLLVCRPPVLCYEQKFIIHN